MAEKDRRSADRAAQAGDRQRARASAFNLIKFSDAKDRDKFFAETAPRVRGIAVPATEERVDGAFMPRFPRLEIVSSFGVGYDHVDAAWAGAHGITVTNTPGCAHRGGRRHRARAAAVHRARIAPGRALSCAPGKWAQKDYPLSKATLRDRTVGMVGMGRIGQAIARRLEAMQVPVVYHSRRPAAGVSYRHYPKLIDMARDVDVLLVITPGGAGDQEPDQCRGARGARPRRHPHQHGARLGGRRAGADQGAAGRRPSCPPASTSMRASPRCRRS